MTPNLEQVSAGIVAFFTKLSEAEQRISLSLYRLLAQGEPVAMHALARAADVPAPQAERTVAHWPGVQRAPDGAVVGYWGLTLRPTRHRMQLDDRLLYTWCAWDTLFLPELLAQRARVRSRCPVSGKEIALEIGPGGVEGGAPRPPVSFIAPDLKKASENLVSNFCRFVHFFATNEAGAGWVAQHPGTVLASLDEAWALGRRRNAARYPRAVQRALSESMMGQDASAPPASHSAINWRSVRRTAARS